ncbi:hypothetical protein ACMD2_20528, partial [Ananas comosus]
APNIKARTLEGEFEHPCENYEIKVRDSDPDQRVQTLAAQLEIYIQDLDPRGRIRIHHCLKRSSPTLELRKDQARRRFGGVKVWSKFVEARRSLKSFGTMLEKCRRQLCFEKQKDPKAGSSCRNSGSSCNSSFENSRSWVGLGLVVAELSSIRGLTIGGEFVDHSIHLDSRSNPVAFPSTSTRRENTTSPLEQARSLLAIHIGGSLFPTLPPTISSTFSPFVAISVPFGSVLDCSDSAASFDRSELASLLCSYEQSICRGSAMNAGDRGPLLGAEHRLVQEASVPAIAEDLKVVPHMDMQGLEVCRYCLPGFTVGSCSDLEAVTTVITSKHPNFWQAAPISLVTTDLVAKCGLRKSLKSMTGMVFGSIPLAADSIGMASMRGSDKPTNSRALIIMFIPGSLLGTLCLLTFNPAQFVVFCPRAR